MKCLMSLLSVLGLAVLFGLSDPAPAATNLVTLNDVQLVSEQTSSEVGSPVAGKNGNGGMNGRGLGRGGGARGFSR